MNWFKNMRIRMKITLAFLIVSMLGMTLGITGLISSQLFASKVEEIHISTVRTKSFAPVIISHFAWRYRLTEAVLTGTEFTGITDPTICSLAQWMNSDGAKNLNNQAITDLLASVSEPHAYIHHAARVVNNHIKAGDKDSAIDELLNNILPKLGEIVTHFTEINKQLDEFVDYHETGAANIANTTKIIIIILIIVVLTCSLILAFLTSAVISKPLAAMSAFFKKASTTGNINLTQEDHRIINNYSLYKDEIGVLINHCSNFLNHVTEISTVINNIAEGDLTHDASMSSDEDTMGLALHRLFKNLNKIFGEINNSITQISSDANNVAETSSNIANSSEQMSCGAQSLAEGATEQAASIKRVSSSITEISEKTKANANITDQAAKLANTIINKAEKGNHQMEDMITAVNEVTEASKSVRMIMETINGIAEQTNLLALNAAIEAARAGEHGKGFAVVAEEVRKLAAQSEGAVKETSSIINTSMKKAELGASVAEEMAASLTEIVSGISESNQLIMKIAKASEEQKVSISQINSSIEQVADIVERNSTLAEESAAASEESAAASEESAAAAKEMRNQVAILRKLISQFKLKDENSKGLALSSG